MRAFSSVVLTFPNADTLKEALQIYDVRELEDLLLDTFYAGLVAGKIDAFAETVCVEFTVGRDVREVRAHCRHGCIGGVVGSGRRSSLERRMSCAILWRCLSNGQGAPPS